MKKLSIMHSAWREEKSAECICLVNILLLEDKRLKNTKKNINMRILCDFRLIKLIVKNFIEYNNLIPKQKIFSMFIIRGASDVTCLFRNEILKIRKMYVLKSIIIWLNDKVEIKLF